MIADTLLRLTPVGSASLGTYKSQFCYLNMRFHLRPKVFFLNCAISVKAWYLKKPGKIQKRRVFFVKSNFWRSKTQCIPLI